MGLKITDNSKLVLQASEEQILKALTACGMLAEGYAKANITTQKAVDTGQLRNSITNIVKEHTVFIGSNLEYAAYVELGTGVYYSGGRRTPWVYQDDDGNWHMTKGMRARPYLKPAIADHVKDYKELIKKTLKS